MQIIVEGLALATFATIRDTATNSLLRELTVAVMEGERRRVAFGVIALRERTDSANEASVPLRAARLGRRAA